MERGCGFRPQKYGRIITVVDFEWTFTGGRVYAVIMGKCHERKPFCPVGLEMIDEHSKVLFDLLINLFGLSICLWVIGGQSVSLDLKQIVEVFHEF